MTPMLNGGSTRSAMLVRRIVTMLPPDPGSVIVIIVIISVAFTIIVLIRVTLAVTWVSGGCRRRGRHVGLRRNGNESGWERRGGRSMKVNLVSKYLVARPSVLPESWTYVGRPVGGVGGVGRPVGGSGGVG